MTDNYLVDTYKVDLTNSTKKKSYKDVTLEQEVELANKIKSVRTYQQKSVYVNQLIEPHLSYAMNIANKFYHSHDFPRHVLHLNDFIGWANEGLLKAALKYSPEFKGIRFLSYACYWVEQSIRANIASYKSTIYQPITWHNNNHKEKVVVDNYLRENGHLPAKGEYLPYTNSNNGIEPIKITYDYVMNGYSTNDSVREGEKMIFEDLLTEEDEEVNLNKGEIMQELNKILDTSSFSLREIYILRTVLFDQTCKDIINNDRQVTNMLTQSSDFIYRFATLSTDIKHETIIDLIEKRDNFIVDKNEESLDELVDSKKWKENMATTFFNKIRNGEIRKELKGCVKKLQTVAYKFKQFV